MSNDVADLSQFDPFGLSLERCVPSRFLIGDNRKRIIKTWQIH